MNKNWAIGGEYHLVISGGDVPSSLYVWIIILLSPNFYVLRINNRVMKYITVLPEVEIA
jgi:hypothetical protein